jgi:hypothetical protein
MVNLNTAIVLGNNVLARNAKTIPQASGGDFC